MKDYFTELSKDKDFIKGNPRKIIKLKDIKYVGGKNYGTFYYDNREIGVAISLTKAATIKSNIDARFTNLLFDEVLIPQGSCHRMISNEVDRFLDLVGSFTDVNDTLKRIFMVSNNTKWINPYFTQWKVPYLKQGQVHKSKYMPGLMVFNIKSKEEFKEEMKKTKFASFIANTNFGSYYIDNESLSIDKRGIVERFKGEIQYNIKFKNKVLSVYRGFNSLNLPIIYISHKVDKKAKTYWVLDSDNNFDVNNPTSFFAQPIIKSELSVCYHNNRVLYSSVEVKSYAQDLYEILNLIKK